MVRLVITCFLLFFVLTAESAWSFPVFRCQRDHVARRACCCPGAPERAGSDGPTLLRARCCALAVVQLAHPPSSLTDRSLLPPPALLPIPTRWAIAALESLPGATRIARCRAGPPLLLMKSSLLI